jgi:hypothetical protein
MVYVQMQSALQGFESSVSKQALMTENFGTTTLSITTLVIMALSITFK